MSIRGNIRRGALAAVLAAMAAAGAPGGANAESYAWHSVKIGGGGYMPNIVFSPAEKGLAYLRSDMGGTYRWDARAASWIALQDGDPDWNARGVESIAPDPQDPDTVYAAVGVTSGLPAKILISHDRGNHWLAVAVPFRMAANDLGRDMGERLAVDPNNPSILYFASRYDGLERSVNGGRNWAKVASFPHPGLGLPASGWPFPAGLSFVLFDPNSGKNGLSQIIYVGNGDPDAPHLYRSRDGGQNWQAVAATPNLRPIQGALDRQGRLYITFADGMGPYMVAKGAVYVLDTKIDKWTDITPDPVHPAFAGLALDHNHPGTLAVAPLYRPAGDTIWRTADGGAHWTSLKEISARDVSATPFLKWGNPEAEFGWWMTGLAIDPFDSNHIAYTTGATVYVSQDLGKPAMMWKPWVEGVEQTAAIALASPPAGPHLYSGIGDIGGYTHEDLTVSPPIQEPIFANSDTVDFAEKAPNVVVRSGTHHAHPRPGERTASLAYSEDFGKTWTPLYAPFPPGYKLPDPIGYNYGDPYIDAPIVVSADGKTVIVQTPDVPRLTVDRGKNWIAIRSVPSGSTIVADRAMGNVFYAVDYARRQFFVSRDGGRIFTPFASKGLPDDISGDAPANRKDIASPVRERPTPLMATPGIAGDLWFVSQGRTFHSADRGRHFVEVPGGLTVSRMAFGKAPPGSAYPALFALGARDGLFAVWRSDDAGKTWIRLNDSAHEYFRAFRAIAADPRVFGRVYVGTDGRGIIYGEPSK